MKFIIDIFLQVFFGWMNVPEWLTTQCFLWVRKQKFILLEQLVLSLEFVPLFCCTFFPLYIKWITAEQWRWLVDFAHVHMMNFWIRHHVKLMKNTRSKAIFWVPLRLFLWDIWSIQILFDWRLFGEYWRIQQSVVLNFGIYDGLT